MTKIARIIMKHVNCFYKSNKNTFISAFSLKIITMTEAIKIIGIKIYITNIGKTTQIGAMPYPTEFPSNPSFS
jgi:hypothetical protein